MYASIAALLSVFAAILLLRSLRQKSRERAEARARERKVAKEGRKEIYEKIEKIVVEKILDGGPTLPMEKVVYAFKYTPMALRENPKYWASAVKDGYFDEIFYELESFNPLWLLSKGGRKFAPECTGTTLVESNLYKLLESDPIGLIELMQSWAEGMKEIHIDDLICDDDLDVSSEVGPGDQLAEVLLPWLMAQDKASQREHEKQQFSRREEAQLIASRIRKCADQS